MGRRKRINVLSLLVVHDILIVHNKVNIILVGEEERYGGG